MNCGYYDSPIGKIKIEAEGNYITSISFVNKNISINDDIEDIQDSIKECKNQLDEYFNGKRKIFDIEIKYLKGTEFQIKVWEELKKIPYGETISYKEMAKRLNNPKAARAIGGANNKNPIGIIIPCHRVIGANGKMVGYAEGIDKKEFLLKLENSNK